MAPVVDGSQVEEVVGMAAGRRVGLQQEVVVVGWQQEVVDGWQQVVEVAGGCPQEVEVAVGCHPRVVGRRALLG